MAIIRFKRGSTDPISGISPTGLTLGEPVLNTQLNKFWIGASGSAGFTAIWVGAEIENSPNWNTPSEYKLATQAAIASRISTIVGACAGVLSIGLSGDWRTRGVTLFGGPSTGGITLGSEVWAGSANPSLNTYPTFGITAGTVLTGKSPMEILELMLVQYLAPAFSNLNMNFVADGGDAGTSTTVLANGMTYDGNGIFAPTFNVTNSGASANMDVGKGITFSVTLQGGITGVAGNIRSFAPVTFTGGNPIGQSSIFSITSGITYPFKGLCAGTVNPRATFTVTGLDTRSNVVTASTNITWQSRLYFGKDPSNGLTYPPDSWKAINKLNGLTTVTGKLVASTTSNNPNVTAEIPATTNPEYSYIWIDSFFQPVSLKAGGINFSVDESLVNGLTLDDGFTTRQYRKYVSRTASANAWNVVLSNAPE